MGCADVQPTNFVNYDPDPKWGAPWPDTTPMIADDPFDLIVANHVLMMVPWPSVRHWLTDAHAALRPGGVLRLINPDTLGAFVAARRDDVGWFPISDDVETTVEGKLCVYLTQAGATRSLFTPSWLIELCLRAGFSEATEMDFGCSMLPDEYEACSLDTRESESFVIEARR